MNSLRDSLPKPHIYYHDGRWRCAQRRSAQAADRFFVPQWWDAMADTFCRDRNPALEEHYIVIVEVPR